MTDSTAISRVDFIEDFIFADPEFARVGRLIRAHQRKFHYPDHGMTEEYLRFLEDDRNIGPGFADDVIAEGGDAHELWERTSESFHYWEIVLVSGPDKLEDKAETAWQAFQASQSLQSRAASA